MADSDGEGAMSEGGSEAVKIVLEWRVHPGAHVRFEEWVRRLLVQAAASGGLEGSSVLSAGDDYFVLLRFAAQRDFDRWRDAAATDELLLAAAAVATRTDRGQLRTGLETWFAVRGRPASAPPPPKWKMAVVTWCALLPQVLVLAKITPSSIPFPFDVVISTAIPVALLTWVIMPRLTALLQRWLYRDLGPAAADPLPRRT